jgi:hypothetical protein
MRPAPLTLRAAALIAVGALVLHELRYLIGHGGHSGEALASQGHAYLPFASALAAGLLVVAAAQLLALARRASLTGAGDGGAPPLRSAWAAATAALLAVYTGQEAIEALLTSGTDGVAAALLFHGGLVVLPLAASLGALVALGLRGASAAVAAAAARARRAPAHRAVRRAVPPVPVFLAPRGPVIARHLAGRAPPPAS